MLQIESWIGSADLIIVVLIDPCVTTVFNS